MNGWHTEHLMLRLLPLRDLFLTAEDIPKLLALVGPRVLCLLCIPVFGWEGIDASFLPWKSAPGPSPQPMVTGLLDQCIQLPAVLVFRWVIQSQGPVSNPFVSNLICLMSPQIGSPNFFANCGLGR